MQWVRFKDQKPDYSRVVLVALYRNEFDDFYYEVCDWDEFDECFYLQNSDEKIDDAHDYLRIDDETMWSEIMDPKRGKPSIVMRPMG